MELPATEKACHKLHGEYLLVWVCVHEIESGQEASLLDAQLAFERAYPEWHTRQTSILGNL